MDLIDYLPNYPSIHPFSSAYPQPAKQGPPGFLLPSHTLQFLLRDPEAFPGQTRYITCLTNYN